jgi:polysaccharide export outer membrane protein
MRALKGFLVASCLVAGAFAQAQAQSGPSESLLIGPGDMLHVLVFNTPELEQHSRVSDSGDVPLMLVGNVHVAGMTPARASATIAEKMASGHFMKHPQVTVNVDDYATQSVAVLGQVKTPGAYPITAPRTAIDIIAMAGGLTDAADRTVTIDRHGDSKNKVNYFFSNDSHQAIDDNVLVYPGDKVVVAKAGIVYVLGDVKTPGGFVMNNNSSQLTALQLVAEAGGTNHSAVPSHAKLMRKQDDGGYQELPLPLSAMQKGKQPDVALVAGDIIYVPFSYLRNVAVQGSGIAASAASAVIYTH